MKRRVPVDSPVGRPPRETLKIFEQDLVPMHQSQSATYNSVALETRFVKALHTPEFMRNGRLSESGSGKQQACRKRSTAGHGFMIARQHAGSARDGPA